MKRCVQRWLESLWYQEVGTINVLKPIGWIFSIVVAIRRWGYQQGWLKSEGLSIPVIVVGNLTVGGTGKTPLIIFLARVLTNAGYTPGIISRGYGGKAKHWPQRVDHLSNPSDVGDEAVLLAYKTGCPLAVGPNRVAAAKLLRQEAACDIILSDDGLQHYALARSLEIAVIDGHRHFGNGLALPAGPLREGVARLDTVDLIVINGNALNSGDYTMHVTAENVVNVRSGALKPLTEFESIPCHALAGIGNPQRFFNLLDTEAIDYIPHVFPDHHVFSAIDINFADGKPVLMTEKDAVKCKEFATLEHWYVPIEVDLQAGFIEHFLNLIKEKSNGYKFT